MEIPAYTLGAEENLEPRAQAIDSARPSATGRAQGMRSLFLLFLASFLALYFELIVIRYLSTEVRVFAYLKNLPLIASFFGLGLGMALGKAPKALWRAFPAIAAILFLLIAYADPLELTHLPFPGRDYFVFHGLGAASFLQVLRYTGCVLAITGLVVTFFIVLGGIVGERLALFPSLYGYAINLAGSLAGIAVYTLVSFRNLPPIFWVFLGFAAALPFFLRLNLSALCFALIILAMGFPPSNVFWSPYYRITLWPAPSPQDCPYQSAYYLAVNYDYHQKLVDLSPAFMAHYPDFEPNHSAFLTYELPYRLVQDPHEVLIVGAGAGNDVASALRHGAAHVDAVEIDPMILELGRKFHPEHPYDSGRVTLHVDDARAFFRKAQKKYDLIIFGYLDSHTLFTGLSSLRLDNYVYTVESLAEARELLQKGGTLVLGFGSGNSFISDRIFVTLTRAFGVQPRVYFTGYDGAGVEFIEGRGPQTSQLPGAQEVTQEIIAHKEKPIPATDHWPFLYLDGRRIPLSILVVLVPFLLGAVLLVRQTITLPGLEIRQSLHFFCLGAGFLLLETKGVTELALLFGSTWIVNAVVIGAFLIMALLANTLVMFLPLRHFIAYAALFVFLGVGVLFPYRILSPLPPAEKVLCAAGIVGFPVFFSGLIFSRSLRDVRQPPQALGVNLLGAVVGGALENLVMLAGIPILGLFAILLYGLSALFARTRVS
jgi:hypothetical protein